MGGVILSRPKAVVVRFVRAESIRGGRTSKDPQWLPEAIHPEAARKCVLPHHISILEVKIIEEVWTYGSFRGN